jgi:hypothetical protein
MSCKKMTRIRSILLAGAGLLLAGLPASAVAHEAVLGNEGELYLVKSGTYGDLFPGDKEIDASYNVLALEITRPGEAAQRVLVPATKDSDVESSPAVIFETDSATVFLVWESRSGLNRSVLRLASFDGTAWAPAIEVTGNSYSAKTSPQLATTRDSYSETDADGHTVLKHRTVLHVTWSEETAPAFYEAFYTPIILDEGTFIGANPILPLNGFDPSGESPNAVVPPELVRTPMTQAGRDGRTVIVSFTSALTGHLVSLEVEVLPTQLRQLADKARAYIIDLGAHGTPDLPAVAAKARDFILGSAEDFQPEVAQSMANLLRSYLLSLSPPAGPPDFAPLAEKARAYIIDLGAKFSGHVLKPATAEAKSGDAQIFQIVPRQEELAQNPPVYLLAVRTLASRPAPAVGTGAIQVFVSEMGTNALVSWAGTDRVYYRDSIGNGWSAVRELKLNDSINLNKAYDVLNQRVQNR